jgi:hypothetical protein
LPETDHLAGVFAFLDASLPENLRLAATEKDFGVGRLEPCDEALWSSFSPFHEAHDRIVEYRHATSSGCVLVRGDRIVWEHQQFRFLVIGSS